MLSGRPPGAGRRHDVAYLVGLALLLCLLTVAIAGAIGSSDGPVVVRMSLPGDGDQDAGSAHALRHPGGPTRTSVAIMRFQLPAPQAEAPAWVVWLPRVPLDAIWLQRGTWQSPRQGFFSGDQAGEALAGGYLIRLPRHWEGAVEAELYVEGGVRTLLRPQVMHADRAARMEQRTVAAAAIVYASLFTLSLLALALHAAARDRMFLSLFACTTMALLSLAAINGHLYRMPGLEALGGWQAQGLWALAFLFLAAWLNLLRHYVGAPRPDTVAARVFGAAVAGLLLAAGICLLNLRALDLVVQTVLLGCWMAVAIGSMLLLLAAAQRRVAMAWLVAALLLPVLVVALPHLFAVGGGGPSGPLASHYAAQAGLVACLVLIAVGMINRIGEYRDQRDRDRLARADTERQMQCEAARTELVNVLQSRLRQLDQDDVGWTAFRTMVDHLLPLLPVRALIVVAHGYHGRELCVTHPVEEKEALAAEFARRLLPLRRQAASGFALQQPATVQATAVTEALVPLQVRAPGWGAMLLHRVGTNGFSSDEMALATEFVRIAQAQVDQVVAAISLRRSAELDALTGSFNRRSTDQWLARSFAEAERDGQPLSVLFVDLDRFKGINDRHGHACGDHCLRAVAGALRGALEEGDLFGRYGGEEFIAILPGRGGASARQAGERLRSAVERLQLDWEGHRLRLTVSVGVATRRDGERTPADTIERADKALYAAKRGGRNCVHVAPAVFS